MKQKITQPGGSLHGFMKRKKRQIAALMIFIFSISLQFAGLPLNKLALAASGEDKAVTPKIELVQEAAKIEGEIILTFTAKIKDVKSLFAYGTEINYDSSVLHYKTATAGNFLGQDPKTPTSFQVALENGAPGKLLLAEAITSTATKVGVSGSGDLFTMQFEVVEGALESAAAKLQFGKNSFVASPTGDVKADFTDVTVKLPTTKIDEVKNLKSAHASDRYGLALNWDTVAGANSYKVYRKNPHGEWKLLKEVTTANLIDKDGMVGGGNLIPNLDYHYKIVAVKGAKESSGVEITVKDTRGLKGDNNRSDRVDGRDLEKLARHFGELDTDKSFDPLADSTYDGKVNGNDLIDLGVNFGKTYKP